MYQCSPTCFYFIYFYFWLHWVFALCGLSLVAGSRGSLHGLLLAVASLGCLGFSSHSSQAQLLCGMWDLPGPGIEPVSPTLGGGLLSTAPPGKSSSKKFLLWPTSCSLPPITMTYLLLWLFISAPANFNTYGGDPLKTPGSQLMTPHLEHPNLISAIAVEQDPMVLGLPVLSLPFVCEKTLAKE